LRRSPREEKQRRGTRQHCDRWGKVGCGATISAGPTGQGSRASLHAGQEFRPGMSASLRDMTAGQDFWVGLKGEAPEWRTRLRCQYCRRDSWIQEADKSRASVRYIDSLPHGCQCAVLVHAQCTCTGACTRAPTVLRSILSAIEGSMAHVPWCYTQCYECYEVLCDAELTFQ
jgi:hypothetical protein